MPRAPKVTAATSRPRRARQGRAAAQPASAAPLPTAQPRPLYFWLALGGASAAIFGLWLSLLPTQFAMIDASRPLPPRWQPLDEQDVEGRLKDSLEHIGQEYLDAKAQIVAGGQSPEVQQLLQNVEALRQQLEAESVAPPAEPSPDPVPPPSSSTP